MTEQLSIKQAIALVKELRASDEMQQLTIVERIYRMGQDSMLRPGDLLYPPKVLNNPDSFALKPTPGVSHVSDSDDDEGAEPRGGTVVYGLNDIRGKTRIRAFGQVKSVQEWNRDPRCKITLTGLVYRLQKGMDPEVAITKPPKDNGRLPNNA